MKLVIKDIDKEFELTSFNFGKIGDHHGNFKDTFIISSKDLAEYIQVLYDHAVPEDAEPESPPAPVEVEYEDVPENLGNYTVAQYRNAKWTTETLLARGMIRVVEHEIIEGEKYKKVPGYERADDIADGEHFSSELKGLIDIPEVPTLPDELIDIPEKDSRLVPGYEQVYGEMVVDGKFINLPEGVDAKLHGKFYKMSPSAGKATFEQFIAKKWSVSGLVKDGYLCEVTVEAEVPDSPDAVPEVKDVWPRPDGQGGWTDSTGDVFNKNDHATARNGKPSITNKGVFKKSRSKKKVEDVPPAPDEVPGLPDDIPEAPSGDIQASGVPSAPEASEVPSAPECTPINDDMPLDDSLEDMIKEWKG